MINMFLKNSAYRDIKNRDEYQCCDICGAKFKEEDSISVLSGAWGILLISHSAEDIKDFFRKKKYEQYPEKLTGMTLKLKDDIRIPGHETPAMKGSDVFCYDACKKPKSITVSIKTRHEGAIASFNEEVNRFKVVIEGDEIDLQ